jgi:hypothetical protein
LRTDDACLFIAFAGFAFPRFRRQTFLFNPCALFRGGLFGLGAKPRCFRARS